MWHQGSLAALKSIVAQASFQFQTMFNNQNDWTQDDPTQQALKKAETVLRKMQISLPESVSDPDDFVVDSRRWIRTNHPLWSRINSGYKVWFCFERLLLLVSETSQNWSRGAQLVGLATQYCQPATHLLVPADFNTHCYLEAYKGALPNSDYLSVLGTNRRRWHKYNQAKTKLSVSVEQDADLVLAFEPDCVPGYIKGLTIESDELENFLTDAPAHMRLSAREHKQFHSEIGTCK